MIAFCTFEPSSGFFVDVLTTEMSINAILVQKLTIADFTSIHTSYDISFPDRFENVVEATNGIQYASCIHFKLNGRRSGKTKVESYRRLRIKNYILEVLNIFFNY